MSFINFNNPAPPRHSDSSPYNTENWLMQHSGPKQSRKVQANDNAPTGSLASPQSFAPDNGYGHAGSAGVNYMTGNGSLAVPSLSGGNENQNGMSHFLPSLNNTVEREAVSQRKHKLTDDASTDDLETKKSKSAHIGTGGSGIISEHIREYNKKQAANGASSAIDLTGDDDDVVITREIVKPKHDPAKEEVCIGTLECQANIHRIPAASEKYLGKEHWPWTRINLKRVMNSRDSIIE